MKTTLTSCTKINSKWVKHLVVRHDSVKLLKEIVGKTFSDKLCQCFLRSVSQGNRNKNKNKQTGPNQTNKCLHSKGNHKQNKKTTYVMGENICINKRGNQQGLNLQSIQAAHTTKKTNSPIEKWTEDLNRHFSK